MRLVWLQASLLDLHRTRDYLRQFNPVAARAAVGRIEAATKGLTRYPEVGRVGEVPGTRELVVSGVHYIVVYRVKGDAVGILRVFHDQKASS